jgi:serine/threonine protein kinase
LFHVTACRCTKRQHTQQCEHQQDQQQQQEQQQRSYAVKCVDTRRLRASDLLSLEREIAISSALHHPGVCAVVDLFVDSSGTSIVQELAAGGDLFERIKRRTFFSEAAAAGVMFQLLHTLAYLHASGIVHRDVKPENILMLSDDDNAAIKLTGTELGACFSHYFFQLVFFCPIQSSMLLTDLGRLTDYIVLLHCACYCNRLWLCKASERHQRLR